MDRLLHLKQRLGPFRDQLLQHRLYAEIDRIEALREFMQQHVFAVWDFMSLLKVLQQRLCCVTVPWRPATAPDYCRLINEIVTAEESDEDGQGGYASHFELYLESMRRSGASTTAIDQFLARLRQGMDLDLALENPTVPQPARRFVAHTFRQIATGDLRVIASAFTFGREDLLPDVFQRIVDELNTSSGGQLERFKYYLERHIGLDGDEHGPMATRLVSFICGDDPTAWDVAEQAAVDCLIARKDLWDGILQSIQDATRPRGASVSPR